MTKTTSQLLRRLLVTSLIPCTIAVGCGPLGTTSPTRVESGLRYQSGQPEFDAFFGEFYQQQTEVARAPDDERALRRDASAKLSIAAGATSQLLVDMVAQRARALEAKKTTLRLLIEGLDADDETDTMVQSQVTGPLDNPSKAFVESATLLARQEVRLAARLRKMAQKLDRLAMQAQALEPSLESSFSAQGYAKYDEARRNLLAAKRNLPLMSLKARELARSCTDFVNKLTVALTTEHAPQAGKAEPPLITSGQAGAQTSAPPKATRAAAPNRTNAAVPATGKPKAKPAGSEASSADFEP